MSRAGDSWDLKLKDAASKWESKLQGVMSDHDAKIGSVNKELDSVKKELASAKTALNSSDDSWKLKLKDAEASWTGKLQGVMSDYDGQINDADSEIAALKKSLSSANEKAKTSAQALVDMDKELFEAEGNIEDVYEVTELEGVGPAYGKKFNNMGIKTTREFASKFLNDDKAAKKAASDTGIDFDAIKSWASMADLMQLPSVGGQYAEILQATGISSRKELSKADAKALHSKMLNYNASHSIVPEVPSLALILRWIKAPSMKAGVLDGSSVMADMTACYEIEEVEGIGPSYGKKFRAIGISTTCDLASLCLNDKSARKKTANDIGANTEVVKSWASMADLMRLPGVGGQFAEIMQTVGMDSRKELKNQNASKLQSKLADYNAKHAIVPEVPTVEMISTWIKASK